MFFMFILCKKITLCACLMTALPLLLTLPVMAVAAEGTDPKLIGTFNDWSAYSYREG